MLIIMSDIAGKPEQPDQIVVTGHHTSSDFILSQAPYCLRPFSLIIPYSLSCNALSSPILS